MGGALTDAVWLFAAFLVLLVVAAVVLASRRFLLERSGGTVECALRRLDSAGQPDHVGLPWHGLGHGGWRLGVLSYQRDELYWYGALGVLLRPEQVFQRRALAVVSRRPADEAEVAALGAGRIVVEVAAKPPADRVRLARRRPLAARHVRRGPDRLPGLAGGLSAGLPPGRLRVTGRRPGARGRPRCPRWRPGRE